MRGVGEWVFHSCSLRVPLLLVPATVVVVKLKDVPILCRTDEVGELCVHSSASANSYYRLQGRTAHTFQVRGEGPLVACMQWVCSAGCVVWLLMLTVT